ncbi:MAG TPA: DUF6084 family protein [Solirubrobacteraceae bacterium]|nr:DUF6084 family protein [Solirubrobacteraceae bacterium]
MNAPEEEHVSGPSNGAPANGGPSPARDQRQGNPGSRAHVAAAAVASMDTQAWPEPDFSVLGVTAVKYAAAPMLNFDLHVVEPSGRQVYMIALTIQVMIEPARRSYDADTHESLKGLFGEPERWAVTTRSLLWAHVDVVIPAFTGATTVSVPITCSYELEVAAAKYFYSLPDGEAPLAFHFNGTIYYKDYDDRMQMVLVPWTKSCDYRMPVSTWKEMIENYYPNTAWVALNGATIEALQREQVNRGLATADACIMKLLEESSE